MSEVKTFLRQCRSELKEIKVMQSQLDRLRYALLPAGVRMKDIDVQTSGGGDMMSAIVPEIVDLERRYSEQLIKLAEHQKTAFQIITGVGDSRYRQLLSLYYMQGLTFEKVAEEMDYSVEHIIRLHGRALEAADESDHKISY